MINASINFQNKLQESSRHFLGRIKLNGDIVDCDIKKIIIRKGACGDETLTIGSVYSSYAEIIATGLNATLENKDIEIQIGMDVSGTPEYITVGSYTVSKVKSSVYETQLTANGFISSKLAVDLPALTSQTIPAIISAIQSATGISISLSGLTASGVITEPLTSMSCKEALSLVAFLLGGYATETADGNIRISKYAISSSRLSVNGDRMLSAPNFADNEFAMTGVKVVVSPESIDEEGQTIPEVYYETSSTVRQIYENKYMTQELFNVFSANVTGYTYMPGEVDLSLGDPRLEPWDCLEVTDNAGNKFNVPCLQIVHTFNGGLSTEIFATGAALSDTEVQGSITKQLGQVNSELIKAQDGATKALTAAQDAQSSATDAARAASNAQTSANEAKQSADEAKKQASDAQESADQAKQSAGEAKQQASEATGAANTAKAQAQSATQSANAALTQLSTVEDVVGVLNWISEHGTYKATTDTEVADGKFYFTRSGTSPNYVYTVVTNPTGNPKTKGYYELDSVDEAVSNYVATHLSLTDAGLWVVKDNKGYKILLANDGMKVYDASGNLVVTYGESIRFSESKAQYIGGENAYIVFDPTTGELSIGGSKVKFGAKTLSQVLTDIEEAQETANNAAEAVEHIEIGGKNLLGATDNPDVPDINNSNAIATFGSIGRYNSPDSEFSIEEYVAGTNSEVITSTATGNRGVGWYTMPGVIQAGETYTFSCKVKANVAANVHTHTAWRNGSEEAGYTGWTKGGDKTLAADTWTDYSYTFTPATNAQLTWEFFVAICFTGATSGITCRFAHAKLEKGNIATDWTPAPEDVEEDITNVAAQANEYTDGINSSLTERLDITDESVGQLKEAITHFADVTALENMTQFVNQYLGSNGKIEIDGESLVLSNGKFSVVLMGDRMVFRESGEAVAYMTNQELYITNARVVQQLRIANFQWVDRNGRLTLMKAN